MFSIIYILCFFRIFMGLIFLTSFIEHVIKQKEFLNSIKSYRIVPHNLVKITSILLLLCELIVGSFLILGLFSFVTKILAAILMGVYACAISLNILRNNKQLSCGCGGVSGNKPISWRLVIRNAVYITLLVFMVLYNDLDIYFSLDTFISLNVYTIDSGIIIIILFILLSLLAMVTNNNINNIKIRLNSFFN